MSGFLPLDRGSDKFSDVVSVSVSDQFRIAEDVSEPDFGVAEETDLQVSVGGHPKPVAASTKVLSHRSDKADLKEVIFDCAIVSL